MQKVNSDDLVLQFIVDQQGSPRTITPPLGSVNVFSGFNPILTNLLGYMPKDAASYLESFHSLTGSLGDLQDILAGVCAQLERGDFPDIEPCGRPASGIPERLAFSFADLQSGEHSGIAEPLAWAEEYRIWGADIFSPHLLSRIVITQSLFNHQGQAWRVFLEGEQLGPFWAGESADSLKLITSHLPAALAGLPWPENVSVSLICEFPQAIPPSGAAAKASDYSVGPAHVSEIGLQELSPVEKIGVVTCYFNPFQDQRILDNYWRFKAELGQPCYSAELSFTGTFDTDADLKISGGIEHILWQKEALLNRLICSLPDSIDAIAWIDADVVFESSGWAEQALEQLQQHEVVQLFSTAFFLDQNQEIQRVGQGVSSGENIQCGLAWAARRDYLRRIGGLYPYVASGANDVIWTEAVFRAVEPIRDYIQNESFHPDYLQSIWQWKDHAMRSLRSTAVNLPGTIRHLYHRKRSNGRYKDASMLLSTYQYSPWKDVTINQDGILQWTGRNLPLQQEIQQWFEFRKHAL